MKGRNMLALMILVLGAGASFYCYSRLSELLPMSDAQAVTKTQAVITDVHTPMVKKGETGSDVRSGVHFRFSANGMDVVGGYAPRGREKAPAVGETVPVVYLNANPKVFLEQAVYADLPRQLTMLRVMMVGFAVVAMFLPFVVMKHR